MDLMKIATTLLMSKLAGSDANANEEGVMGALSGLLGGNDGNLDIGSLVSKLSENGGLGDVLSSWLGDGDNAPISADTVKDIFDGDALSGFASKLGVDVDTAANGLSDVIPEMVDKSSSGGSLLDAVGGISGALDMAKKFLG